MTDLLTLSQVVLALQLPLAMFPLLHFTSSREPGWANGPAAGFCSRSAGPARYSSLRMDIYGLPELADIRLANHRRRLTQLHGRRSWAGPKLGAPPWSTHHVRQDPAGAGPLAADRPIIDHIKQLAGIMHSRVVLFHVATGPAAQFHVEDAGGKEVKKAARISSKSAPSSKPQRFRPSLELAFGEPGKEIIKWVDEKGCDLVAMGTHGHKLLADLFLGATASRVQHNISVPVLLLKVG